MPKTFLFVGVLLMFLLGACAGPVSNQQATNATGGLPEITVYRSPT